STGALSQITDIRRGPAPKEPKPTDNQKFIEQEQKNLFVSMKEKADDRKETEDKQKKRERIKPFYLGQRENVRALQVSPDEKWIMFFVDEDQDGTRNTIVPDYVTVSGYVEDINSRSNVGDLQRKSKLGVQSVPANGNVEATVPRWVDNGLAPRAAQFNRAEWSPDGKNVVSFIFSEDHKDRWMAL